MARYAPCADRTGPGWLVYHFSSEALLDELTAVVRRRKFRSILIRSNTDLPRMLRELRWLVEVAKSPRLVVPVSRDPDDDAVLATAILARADLIVFGDEDLLTIGTYDGIPIVTPAAALIRLRNGRGALL